MHELALRIPYPEIAPFEAGRLRVDAIHEIYFEQYGNPNGKPALFVHGGPGGGTTPAQARFWDPSRYRIVLFDQRGCGRSTPHACLEHNTTWDLVSDIEALYALGQRDFGENYVQELVGKVPQLPDDILNDERFLLLDRRLQFDQFDAVLSFCTCFVGNDSGPKHLASLRGANVVSLHTARINWGEWGQEQTGKIVHRQVPCAGCHVYPDHEECGKDYACVRLISLDDVWNAMAEYL